MPGYDLRQWYFLNANGQWEGPQAAPAEAQQQGVYYDVEQLNALQRRFLDAMQQADGAKQPPEAEEPDDMPSNLRLLNTFKIGSDPEFVVLAADGSLCTAEDLNIPHAGAVGYDHGGRVLEIRPRPSRHARTHLRSIALLLTQDSRLATARKQARWQAGAMSTALQGHEPLGGHIHLDVPYADEASKQRIAAMGRLTKQLEDCEVFPRKDCDWRRRDWPQYGGYDNVRPAGHNYRLEYRAPASWLFSPRVALYALTAYKLACAAPEATACLSAEGSARELRKFMESFRGKDDDADYILEKFLEHGGLKTIKGDPDADVKAVWSDPHFLEVLNASLSAR